MQARGVLAAVVFGAPLVGLSMPLAPIPTTPEAASDFVHFESSHVHPLALTPDGTRLLVVNTPDGRLSVFDVTGSAPIRVAEIPVGLEPVSVAARNNGEAWVINALSDDASVVDLQTMNVRATLPVGDEPADVVFAGVGGAAYVSVSREDVVKVYNPSDLAASPVVIPIPGRMPRALARTGDGAQVLVDVFHSSAEATVLSAAEAGDSLPPLDPALGAGLPAPPKTGLLIKRSNGHWTDASGHLWDSKVPYSVPAVEVVSIATVTNTVTATAGGMASTLMGLAIDPVTDAVAVTGTYAAMEIQLEPNIRGRMTAQRAAILRSAQPPAVVALNPHINYSSVPGPSADADSALGMPTGVCWAADGTRVYATSMATNRIGVIEPAGLGSIVARVPTVAGPTGVIADPVRPRLYVLGRHHEQLQTLSTADLSSLAVSAIGFDPTPDAIVNGRKFFYGGFTSGHGDQSCASCHLFGDVDDFAWNLGDPVGSMSPVPPGMIDPLLMPAHPVKGPMMTQSLRGLGGTGLLHWRGDRANLTAFNAAFVSLMGRATALADSEMTALADFVLPLAYPPNPNRRLDRSLADAPPGQPSAKRGETFFKTVAVFARPPFTGARCVTCHAFPAGTNGQFVDGGAIGGPQDMKIPHLRNLHTKVGFRDSTGVVNKRGMAFTHDGSVDNLFEFLRSANFDFGSPGAIADEKRRDVESFLLAFDTGLAPAIGAQVTFDGGGQDAARRARLDTLVQQAAVGACDLIAKGRVGSMPRGWHHRGGVWEPDRVAEASLSTDGLLGLATVGHELTVTGVPVGSGQRAGVDRDRDGFLDADELDAGTDPGDPGSSPLTAVGADASSPPGILVLRPSPFAERTTIEYALSRSGPAAMVVFDLSGRRVRNLVHDERAVPGRHAVTWDGRGITGLAVSPGIYFVRLTADGHTWRRTLVRLR